MELEQLKIDRDVVNRRTRRRGMSGWAKLGILVVILGALGLVFRTQIRSFVLGLTTPLVKLERVAEKNAASVAAATGTSANGYIVARTRAALSADTPGRIVELNVEEGSTVKKGFVVARLYSDEYAASLAQAKAEVKVAEAVRARAQADVTTAEKSKASMQAEVSATEADVAQYEATLKLAIISLDRAKGLLADKVDTVDRVDRAQRDLEEARARVTWARARREAALQAVVEAEARVNGARSVVAEAEARIVSAEAARNLALATFEKTEVRAPFDGIVVLKDAEVGEVVSPNSQGGSNARGSVVTMVDFATLEVQAEVSETTIANVKVGGEARIYLDAYPEKPYAGSVDRIWPTANRTKATVEVRVTFRERDERLRPEMGVRVVFVENGAAPVKEDPRMLVSRNAVVVRDGTSRVFVFDGERVHLRSVKTGPERAGRIVVLEGLVSGEWIVVDPPATLREGDRARKEGS